MLVYYNDPAATLFFFIMIVSKNSVITLREFPDINDIQNINKKVVFYFTAGYRRLARQPQTCFVAISKKKNYAAWELPTYVSQFVLFSFKYIFSRENPFDFVILPLLPQNGLKHETREICLTKWPQWKE